MSEEVIVTLLEEIRSLKDELKKELTMVKSDVPRKPVYSNRDLETMFGVTPQTLIKWRNNGYIGYSKTGNVISYTAKDIKDFMERTHYEAYYFESHDSIDKPII